MQLPIGAEDKFIGIVDLITMKAVVWEDESLGAKFHEEQIPAESQGQAEEYREKLLEAAADCDEAIMEKYLEGKPISEAGAARGDSQGDLALKIVPVVCGSAFRNKGVQPMLDAVVDFLPSPVDIPPVKGVVAGTDKPEERPAKGRRAVFRAGFQNHDRPFRRYVDIFSGLFGLDQFRREHL